MSQRESSMSPVHVNTKERYQEPSATAKSANLQANKSYKIEESWRIKLCMQRFERVSGQPYHHLPGNIKAHFRAIVLMSDTETLTMKNHYVIEISKKGNPESPMSRRTVDTHLNILEEVGLIRRIKRGWREKVDISILLDDQAKIIHAEYLANKNKLRHKNAATSYLSLIYPKIKKNHTNHSTEVGLDDFQNGGGREEALAADAEYQSYRDSKRQKTIPRVNEPKEAAPQKREVPLDAEQEILWEKVGRLDVYRGVFVKWLKEFALWQIESAMDEAKQRRADKPGAYMSTILSRQRDEESRPEHAVPTPPHVAAHRDVGATGHEEGVVAEKNSGEHERARDILKQQAAWKRSEKTVALSNIAAIKKQLRRGKGSEQEHIPKKITGGRGIRATERCKARAVRNYEEKCDTEHLQQHSRVCNNSARNRRNQGKWVSSDAEGNRREDAARKQQIQQQFEKI